MTRQGAKSMKRPVAIGAIAGMLGVTLLAAPGSTSAADCGDYAGNAVITRGEVPCRKAKAIVKEFVRTRKSSVQGYSCKGSETSVYCRLAGKTISWRK